MSTPIFNQLIAYIDFLGTKNKIINDPENKHYHFLKNLYTKLYNYIDKTNNENIPYLKKIKIKIFSDNILLSTSANLTKKQLEYAFGDFIYLCAMIQTEAFKKGILSRGGITIGELSNDSNFVYGKGLLDAVYLEETKACYPRIIIHESLENMCDENNKWQFNTYKDNDNIRYIDFFKSGIKNENDLKIYTSIIEKLKKDNTTVNAEIIKKNEWVINKFEAFKKEFYKQSELTKP